MSYDFSQDSHISTLCIIQCVAEEGANIDLS